MGNQLSLITPLSTVGIDAYIEELPDIQYEKELGRARFLKTLRGWSFIKGTKCPIVIKVFIRSIDVDLEAITAQISHEAKMLDGNVVGVLPYTLVKSSDRAGYLIRQYLQTNIYDRISTRPFLESTERLWISYQLLRTLEVCHSKGVFHGDIKSENILVTTSNNTYLTDFSGCFKPIYLPEDDPAQFSFFFDTSQRRSCYIAPERFLAKNQKIPQEQRGLNSAMDIFSLGCVIAELFNEGSATFTLAQLFGYKRGEYLPMVDPKVAPVVRQMLSINPLDRPSISACVKQWEELCPSYFRYLYGFSNEHVWCANSYDSKIMKIAENFLDIAENLKFNLGNGNKDLEISRSTLNSSFASQEDVYLNLSKSWVPTKHEEASQGKGGLILLSQVTSNIRNVQLPSVKVVGCQLILALGEQLDDDAKIDRCISMLLLLVKDPSELVASEAIRCITQLLRLIKVLSPINSYCLSEYIFPGLSDVLNCPSSMVRATFATNLPRLAETADKFLDMVQVMKMTGVLEAAEEDDPDIETGTGVNLSRQKIPSYGEMKQLLIHYIETQTMSLLADTDNSVKRALLQHVVPLCVFFGKNKTNDVILGHLITYLNDGDYNLRIDFFVSVIALAPHIGVVSIEQYILPLMQQSLTDPEELVTATVLQSLTTLAELGLIRVENIWGILKTVAKLVLHPNPWIRDSVCTFISASSRWVSKTQLYCIFLPMISPYLHAQIDNLSAANILLNAKDPLLRPVYNLACNWVIASRTKRSLFWSGTGKFNADDEQWLTRLEDVGFHRSDIWKLSELRPHFSLLTHAGSKLQLSPKEFPAIVKVSDLKVGRSNVIADNHFLDIRQNDSTSNLYDSGDMISNSNILSGVSSMSLDELAMSDQYAPSRRKVQLYKRLMLKNSVEAPDLSDPLDFGPQYAPFTRAHSTNVNSASGRQRRRVKPLGVLVSSFDEHTGAINSIAISPDHKFFISASDDGSVKIWDSSRLEKNAINRSVHTLDFKNGDEKQCRVVFVAFMENTYTFVLSLSNGSIKLVRCSGPQEQGYETTILSQHYEFTEKGEYALWMEHIKTARSTLLYVITSHSRIIALDPKNFALVHVMQNPQKHGFVTSCLIDRKRNWMLIGTSKGILDLWDLRFLILSRSCRLGTYPVTSLAHHLGRSKEGIGKETKTRVCVAGGTLTNEVTVWVLENLECTEVYNTSDTVSSPVSQNDAYRASLDLGDLKDGTYDWSPREAVNAIATGIDFEGSNTRRPFLISGGNDRILRFWNMHSVEQSCVISGLPADAGKPTYTVSTPLPYTRKVNEKIILAARPRNSATDATSRSRQDRQRGSIIAAEQLDMTRCHQTPISCVNLLMSPFWLILSGDRSGSLKVYL